MTQPIELDDTQKAILAALATMTEPAGCGEIAQKAGLITGKVVPKMRGLLKNELVERPVAAKYIIAPKGRTA